MRNGLSKLMIALGVLLASALPVQAEIYKWVDKDGTVKYTDTPPPAGAKSLSTIGKKTVTPATPTPSPEASQVPPGVNAKNQTSSTDKADSTTPEAQAKKKRELEEIAKKNKAELDAQAKKKELNCATAKTNYQTYSQGGRIYKTNEKGEREYVDEKGLADGAAQAQRDMQEYCN
jgi:hypothetical protein